MKTAVNLLAPSAAVAANGNGASFDLRGFDDHHALLSVDVTTPAGVTYTPALQTSDDNATWTAVAGIPFVAVTPAQSLQQVFEVDVNALGRYVRVVDTVAGGTAQRAVVLVAQRKYV